MSQFVDVRSACAPPQTGGARELFRWVCTNNPFYILSAGLFLVGLRISFGAEALEEVWAMMLGHGRLHAAAGRDGATCWFASGMSGTTCGPSCCWSC